MINCISDELIGSSLNARRGFYKDTVTAFSLQSGAFQTQKVIFTATSNVKVELFLNT